MGYGVIVTRLQIVEAGFGVVVVATVAEGIDLCHGAGGVGELTPGVVGVAGNHGSAGIDKAKNVTLQVQNIVIGDRIGGVVAV